MLEKIILYFIYFAKIIKLLLEICSTNSDFYRISYKIINLQSSLIYNFYYLQILSRLRSFLQHIFLQKQNVYALPWLDRMTMAYSCDIK